MAACGLLISWQLRHQDAHATPPAIFIACATASLLSAYLGWYFAKFYELKPRLALFLFPLTIVFLTSVAVASIYILVQSALWHQDYLPSIATQAKYFPSYMMWYGLFSAVIWLPAFAVGTVFLKRVAKSELRI
jgi:hypothetical protein